jgi:hypothetical protein
MGKQYERRKKREGGDKGNQYTKMALGNNYQEPKPTSSKIAEEQKVSEKTVRNAAEYSRAIDDISQKTIYQVDYYSLLKIYLFYHLPGKTPTSERLNFFKQTVIL